MYEMTPGWEAYYEEFDAEERKEILERLLQELPDDGLHAFRKKVYELRYPNQGKKGRSVDQFLLYIVYAPGLYSKKNSVFYNLDREINKMCKDLGLNQVDSFSEEEKAVLYLEYHNAAELYFSTCRDAGYGRKLFGMVQSDSDDRMMQVCSEAWIVARGIPAVGGKEKEMELFSEAILDSYFHFDKKAEKMFREYEETQKQRVSHKKKGWFSA